MGILAKEISKTEEFMPLMIHCEVETIERLKEEFLKLIERVIEKETITPLFVQKLPLKTSIIKFTKIECLEMGTGFLKSFRKNGSVARIVKSLSNQGKVIYEIKYRRDGYNIRVSSSDLKEAKQEFIKNTKLEK